MPTRAPAGHGASGASTISGRTSSPGWRAGGVRPQPTTTGSITTPAANHMRMNGGLRSIGGHGLAVVGGLDRHPRLVRAVGADEADAAVAHRDLDAGGG